MKLYIPEIGDQIILSKDWTFPLHAERRNVTMGLLHNHYLYNWNIGWIDENVLPNLREPDYVVVYPTQDEIDKRCKSFFGGFDWDLKQTMFKEANERCPEFVKYQEDFKIWNEIAKNIKKEILDITIDAGQVLTVDRIYIRKGISEYSSITFYAKGLGTVKKSSGFYNNKVTNKAIRFWAKLSDVNNIEFEPFIEK